MTSRYYRLRMRAERAYFVLLRRRLPLTAHHVWTKWTLWARYHITGV